MRRYGVIVVAFVVPILTGLLCPWSLFSPRPPDYRECYGYSIAESGIQVRCEEAGEGKWTNHIDGEFTVTNTAQDPIRAYMSVSLWDPDRQHPISFFKCQPADGVELAPGESTEFSCPDKVAEYCANEVLTNPYCAWVTPAPPGQEAPAAERTGQVRVTLEWDDRIVDLDLMVIDPSGEEISKAHPSSASGGSLDWNWCCDPFDALCGLPMSESDLPTETVEWQPGTALDGEYQVFAFYHTNCEERSGDVEFTVRVEVDDDPPVEHRGRASLNQRTEITTFSR
jgi:hypothetical protein